MENLDKLVNELRKLPTETQWLEFKHNNYTPDMIGKDISALGVHPERQPSPDFRTGDLGLLQPCQDPGKVCKWWVLIWRSAREKSKTSETAKEF